MRLWQATWEVGGQLLLWGETLHPDPQTVPEQDAALPLHPRVCTVEQLSADLEAFEVEQVIADELLISLPGSAEAPLSSPRLPQDIPAQDEPRQTLHLWRVPAVRLHPQDAMNVLTYIPPTMPAGLKMDDSFGYWREASKFLLELLTRGRFLPGVQRLSSTWHARWQLVPSESKDYDRLSVIAKAMPPLCRAVRPDDQSEPPEPSRLLESFLSICSDALIRMFLSRLSLLQGIDQSEVVGRFGVQTAWLNALTRRETELRGPEHELLNFEQRLHSWSARVMPRSQPKEVRTCFQLLSPADSGTEQWTVKLLLQSCEHPSELLPAEQLWQGNLGFLKHSGVRQPQIEEQLLRDLGRAVKVFPAIRSALDELQPMSADLRPEEAYTFLRETAKLLEELDFGVLVPEWWESQSTRVGLSLRVDAERLESVPKSSWGFLSSQHLLDCSWAISLAGKTLSLEEFEQLTQSSSPLVRIDGNWVELQPERIAATKAFLRRQQGGTSMTLLETLRFGLGVQETGELLPVVEFNASGWIEQLLDASNRTLPPLSEPEGFVGSLRPYQRDGLTWLAFLSGVGVGGCLADDMGLGKTIQFLALVQHEHQLAAGLNREKPAPSLLIVPMSTLDNWQQEAERFTPGLKVYIHHGPARCSGRAFHEAVREHDIIVTTYSLAFRDEKLFGEIRWGRIALDEAQNIKNQDAKQTKAIRSLGRRAMAGADMNRACHRLALTGTPLENHLDELWSIFDFLNPGFLGTLKEFRSRFTVPIERYRNTQAAEALSSLIQPFTLRRLKSDPKIISDLPEKIEMEISIKLTEEQALLYRAVLKEMLPQVDTAMGIHRKGLVLATITKLKQICDHPSLFLKDGGSLAGRSGKLARLEELLEVVLAEGDRVLIFTQYAQMGHLLRPYLQERFDREVLFLHGGLARSARDNLISKFRLSGGPPIFILSLKAGGFGLNLTEANQVIHYDQWWNPAVQEQATDRAYRIGQKRAVQVRTFISSGTLEERINQMLKHKRDLADQVVGTTKSMVSQMSIDELRRLLQFTGKEQEEDEEL